MTLPITIGVLTAGAVYLFMQREMLRVILGFILIGHAANLVIMAAGGTSRRGEPFGTPDNPESIADPLPQAFVLTAIVIAFSITIFMLVLSATGTNSDDTTDDDPSADEIDDLEVSLNGPHLDQPSQVSSASARTSPERHA